MLSLCFLDRGVQPAPEKIIQLKAEIARLHPTREELQKMQDRFIRNNNFGDFALHRFVDGGIPLYTQKEMEQHVEKKLATLIRNVRLRIHALEATEREQQAIEYVHMQDHLTELQHRYMRWLDDRRETERRRMKYRLANVRRWLCHAPEDLVKEAFQIALHEGEITLTDREPDTLPTDAEMYLARTTGAYAELLFSAVEKLMRRLPCHNN